MKKTKPPVGGSGDSTSRSYHINTKNTSLNHQITGALAWLQDYKASGPARQAIQLALGETLIQYFQTRTLK